MQIIDRIELVFKAMFSKNVILIYDIKQRVYDGKLVMICKVKRNTAGTGYEDIETIENALQKVVKKVIEDKK